MATIIDPEVRCTKCGFQDSTPIDPLFFIHKKCVNEIKKAFSREKEIEKLAIEEMLRLFGKENSLIRGAHFNGFVTGEQATFMYDFIERMQKEIRKFKI